MFFLRKYMHIYRYLGCLLLSLLCSEMNAQVVHVKNASPRNIVDLKRAASDMNGREALLRSREFIREDSTYYVGYLYEGVYKATHATDFFGFQNAIAPLAKAMQLLEKDYDKQLNIQTTDGTQIYYAYSVQNDYQELANQLYDCYMNTEQYGLAYGLCRNVLDRKLIMEYYFTGYTSLTWITNKLKTKTSKDYYFLENTVADNLALANRYLDTALIRNDANNRYIGTLMPGVRAGNIQSVNHYRALIYSYDFNIDSADKYYDILKAQNYYSHNNRGNYLMLKGLFRQAEIEYTNEANLSDFYKNKHLKEFIYYQSMIDIYKQQPKVAIQNLTEAISNAGTTPGFGWYNIALARAYLYDGNLAQSQTILQKASKFKELHIGTSLGQAHYDFSRNMMQYQNAKYKLQWLKKRYKSWWWHPSVVAHLVQLSWEVYTTKYLLITQLSSNPEREMVIYTIFASESVTTWDEVMGLIQNLDASYFIDYFEQAIVAAADRPVIQGYYKLILARLYLNDGDTEKAAVWLQDIADNQDVDTEYEQLFLARYYELLGDYNMKIGETKTAGKWYQEMYVHYPQMAGFTKYPQPFYIQWDGEEDEDIMEGLERANIQIVANNTAHAPTVNIASSMEGKTKTVVISVVTADGLVVSKEQRFFTEDKEAMNYSILRAMYGMATAE